MAQLLFFDADHQYEIDGTKVPSVSEILRFMSREVYGDINQYTLDHAAERGTAVHKAAELLDKYGEAEIDDDIAPYVKAYISFVKDHGAKWQDIERRMFHPARMYAGTIDRFGDVDGSQTLVDIKTNSTVKKPIVKAQLNAYEDMREANGMPKAEKMLCLQLKSNGTYTIYDVPQDMTEFNACYDLHTALAKKQPKGGIS